MKNLTAVLALLGLIQVEAINVESVQKATMMTEETRYIGSNGKPINLAQTQGHARLSLKRVQKF